MNCILIREKQDMTAFSLPGIKLQQLRLLPVHP